MAYSWVNSKQTFTGGTNIHQKNGHELTLHYSSLFIKLITFHIGKVTRRFVYTPTYLSGSSWRGGKRVSSDHLLGPRANAPIGAAGCSVCYPRARSETVWASLLGRVTYQLWCQAIWLARHWQEPSHESRWLTCARIRRDCLPEGRGPRHLSLRSRSHSQKKRETETRQYEWKRGNIKMGEQKCLL